MKVLFARISILTLAITLFVSFHAFCQEYMEFDGMVGKARAKFNIRVASTSWGTSQMAGSYYLVNRPKVVYALMGTFKKKTRVMSLEEYTPNRDTATFTARIELIGDFMTGFVGKMINTLDEKRFTVVLNGIM